MRERLAEGPNVQIAHIQARKAQQVACVERCNPAVRYDRLNQHLFQAIGQAGPGICQRAALGAQQ